MIKVNEEGKAIKAVKALDPMEIRKDFPIFAHRIKGKPLIYLDNAATTQRPKQVIETVKKFYEEANANVHRGLYTLSYEATRLYEEAHKKAANFINAPSWREIIFTRNATEAINLVAYAWGMWSLKPGDEVLITIMEHHSNIIPWQLLKKHRDITLKFLDVDDQGRLKLEELPTLLSQKTKLVGVSHVSNVLGTINPVDRIVEEAQRVGALVLIDAAQSAPHMPIDVQELGCDFLVASGHKMLGPTGIGFLYAKESLLTQMEPFLGGGEMIETVTEDYATWNELPWKYEAGTPNIAGGIGLGAALDYLQELGMERIQEYEQRLLEYALDELARVPTITIYGPQKQEDRIGVISFNLEGIPPHDLAYILDEEGIAIRSGHNCAQPLLRRLNIDNAARLSLYIYNTKEEIDTFIMALEKAKKIFSA